MLGRGRRLVRNVTLNALVFFHVGLVKTPFSTDQNLLEQWADSSMAALDATELTYHGDSFKNQDRGSKLSELPLTAEAKRL